jgi:hypothetical protein
VPPAASGWSAAVAIVSSNVATGSLGASATSAGAVVAAWVEGPPPRVKLGGPPPWPPPVRPSAVARLGRQRVMVAVGSFARGVGRPLQLSAGRSGAFGALRVAMSAPDTAYVAWEQTPGPVLRLSVVRAGRVVVARRLLARDAVPLALFPTARGRAALVFDRYGHGTPYLDYAIVSRAGTLGAVARVGHPGTNDTADAELSANRRGELVAAWVHDDIAPFPVSRGVSSRYRTAQLVVSACRPALRCAAPVTVALGHTKPACIDPAVAIGPAGTVTVIASAQRFVARGCAAPLGLWESLTAPGASALASMRMIDAAGASPVAAPAGRSGTTMLFYPGAAPYESLSSLWLPARPAGQAGPLRPSALDRGGEIGEEQPGQLAAAGDGWWVMSWEHSAVRVNPRVAILAVVGRGATGGPASVAVPSGVPVWQYVTAVDGRGDAMLLYTGSTSRGSGAPYPYSQGVYVETARR